MNRINGLSDDLLVKILSFLPTKVAISTSIFPLRRFLDRSMPLHKASVIESFRLDLAFAGCKPEDIKLWIFIALLDGESFRKILSICPVLENLLVKLYGGYVNMGMINVSIPSLLRLSLQIPYDGLLDGLVIDTPSLKYLKLEDYDKEYLPSCLIEDLPQLEEAYLDVNYRDVERLIGSITSLELMITPNLTLIFSTFFIRMQAIYRGKFVFNQLEHLKLCVGINCVSSLPVRLLEDSPNLRELDLFEMDHKRGYMAWWNQWNQWNQPDTVPKCITSSLQTSAGQGTIWNTTRQRYCGLHLDKRLRFFLMLL
ncbi:BnaCnng44720D [Brassica napus]|uniref:BnaCnng44720D protein n=1 Tax=Brassica napus TaxID=3708 RepID=A0A078JB11_BRANA|nr:BnaCnng44720D [Brassica napus]